MNSHDTLSVKRLSWLMINDLRLHSKNIMIVAATLIVFFALVPYHVTSNTTAYFSILYIGGFIISSFAFADYHDPRKAFLFLTLPCTNLERFLSKWLSTTVMFSIGLLSFYYLFSLLSYSINLLVYHQQMQLLDISQPALWVGIGKYITLQSVVLLGAITFKKYALIKTGLTIGCILLVFSLVMALLTWIFCPNCILNGIAYNLSSKGHDFIFWLIAAPLFWVVTYLRLNEIELR